MNEEGELKRRLFEAWSKVHVIGHGMEAVVKNNPLDAIDTIIDEAKRELPKVSQEVVPMKENKPDWEALCKKMELKIIEFELFGKKWFGGDVR